MQKNNQTAYARLEQILDRLANGDSNDTEIDTLHNLLWAAFEMIPAENHPQFFSKTSSCKQRVRRT